ncbi:hypothetical protein [Streptomyces sp. GQFP]|uniref:hypothetical protein n=1 Tax=Streptomyces sp. GQFP TaxID=2907545 RepID=UPI001F3E8239|nr:hypothetical protein [Streptomyces sp. GQFP]UIX33647.1 hypothetical protein LUX31_28605 [Streptomyces sp. GQFP]
MPVFRRAEWPRDHRDEFVAGALVGAVVIVLGYASGIGASTASGAAEAAAPPSSLPAATAPPNSAPGDSGAQAPGSGTGMDMGGGTGSGWTGQVPVDTGQLPVYGDPGTGSGDGTAGHGGHTGHGTSPTPTPTTPPVSSSPSPSPSDSAPPTDDATCADGEVRLVAPVLTGITQPLFGLLNGTDADETPEPTASPCVGLAPLSSLLGGSASASPSASPLPEATP